MFTLAHLSDVHLGGVGLPPPRTLMSKRVLGLLSWHLRRKAIHEGPVLPALVDDLHREGPDHTVVTGDLVNISLPAEFRRAAAWLAGLGTPADVTVVPGNHDAYVPVPWDQSLGLWSAYLAGDTPDGVAASPSLPPPFPSLRRRGPLALIGLSSAEPMPPHMAAGRLGPAQLARLGDLLDEARSQDLCRVVLIHHPPLSKPAYERKALIDRTEFAAVIAAHGAELILHGHTHMSGLHYLPAPQGKVPVIGVPSASARPTEHHDPSRYHLYRIERAGSGWRIAVEVRTVARSLDRFIKERDFLLAPPAGDQSGSETVRPS